MSRKLPIMASLAAGCLLSSGAVFATGSSFAPAAPGSMTLWVNTITGDVQLVGNNTSLFGYEINSSSGTLNDANWLKPFSSSGLSGWFAFNPTGSEVSEGTFGSVTAGPMPPVVTLSSSNASATPFPNDYNMGNIYNIAENSTSDLNFVWGQQSSGNQVPGTVQYATPEPASLALLAAGGLGLLARRRRKNLA